MSHQQCKDALEIYKKFIARMDRVRAFLRVAEVGDWLVKCTAAVNPKSLEKGKSVWLTFVNIIKLN